MLIPAQNCAESPVASFVATRVAATGETFLNAKRTRKSGLFQMPEEGLEPPTRGL